ESYDTIRLTDGSSFSTTRSGDDVIVYVGSGAMTLKNASNKTLHIVNDNYTGFSLNEAYWFDELVDDQNDELGSILNTTDNQIDLSTNLSTELLNHSTFETLSSSAQTMSRRRHSAQ
ncbi:MAG: hypothetical protein IJ668_11000, partial [Selenomonadaceae bacterium]|nr:hypothetical protein [Selenomonadaceae bacterium]